MIQAVNFGDVRLPDRFWDKVVPEPNSGCWIWTATLHRGGYGQIHTGSRVDDSRRMLLAHRVSYMATVGSVPDGLELDHKCRVRCCVNPAHLEPVTGRENTLRGTAPSAVHAKKTHCPAGHPYDEANTYRPPNSRRRECRTCGRAQSLASYHKRKAARS